jgi:hypothetical protein
MVSMKTLIKANIIVRLSEMLSNISSAYHNAMSDYRSDWNALNLFIAPVQFAPICVEVKTEQINKGTP